MAIPRLPWPKYPSPGRPCLVLFHDPAVPHQHRVRRRPQRHHLSGRCLRADKLPDLDRLSYLASSLRCSVASACVVAWPLRLVDQHRCLLLRSPALVLRFVSTHFFLEDHSCELLRTDTNSSWPLALPVDAASMNWSSVLFVSCILISIIFWFVKGRHVYTGPVVQMRREL